MSIFDTFLTFLCVLYGNKLPIGNNKKSAEICGNSGSGSWTRTNDIRINSQKAAVVAKTL